MGTHYSVKIVDLPQSLTEGALGAEVDAAFADVDARMSTYRDDSEVSRFNASTSVDWQEISPGLLEVLETAQRISRMSDGAFDVTVGPLVDLWGFGPAPRRDVVPDGAEIAAARARVGFDAIETRDRPPALRKSRPDVALDLSAIAEGHAIDRVAALLEAHGIGDYVVELGGELRARGSSERGEPWAIAIEQPVPEARRAQRIVHVSGASVATSGSYRNYFEAGGRHYSHIIDPRTGAPVDHDLVSVTVIATSSMHAGALATALLVLGPEAGYALAVREGIAALLVRRSGDSFVERPTPALDAYLE
jgi:thiamine biosynthesis lipoprotein